MTTITVPGLAASNKSYNKFINKSLYDNVYPSTINETRQIPLIGSQNLEYGQNTTGSTTSKPIMNKRRVVKRTTNARAATSSGISNISNGSSAARSVVPRRNTPVGGTSNARNIGRSSGNISARATSARAAVNRITTNSSSSSSATTSQRCFADYKECMETYCQREDTAYNRCYCSAKLAQIDAKYQNKIDELIQKIIVLQYKTDTNSEDIAEYWDRTVGTYTNTNPWVSIDNALNINWADTESRVRGQNAFATGHSYCVANLRSCSYMATNLRDAYKSEIARDCETYEKGLQKIQTAAESVIESYND